jgi:predicted phosphodiesterase
MYKYEHFIPENIAPVGATSIGVYNGNTKVFDIPLGRLAPPTVNPLYTFCALSDVHVYDYKYPTSSDDFKRALSYANENCEFTCIAGDLVSSGGDSELSAYKNLVDTYSPNKPVYAITGNHETSYGYDITDDAIRPYTGQPLYYSFTQGNDVFIMVGYYGGNKEGNGGWRSDEFVSVAELQWLYETLETNRNKRCFVFEHVLPHEHGVGNPSVLYKSALIWKTTDGGIGQALMSLLKHYKNVIVFHGHSHTQFDLQEIDNKANYSSTDGYRSIHIPSLSVPREVVNGSLSYANDESEGYIVDVYDNYIILNGRDFVDNDSDGNILPIATYKIDTTLVNIPEKSFTDSTGIIQTI